jgi:integrase
MKKPKLNYILESKSKNVDDRLKDELITAIVHSGFYKIIDGVKKYERFKISLQATIKPKNFGLKEKNFKFDQTIFDKFSKTNGGVSTKMNLLETKIETLYSNYLLTSRHPSAIEFKKALLVQMERKQADVRETVTIKTYLANKIKEIEKDVDSGKRSALKDSSIKPYVTLLNYIKKYELAKNIILTFENFNEVMYWDFWEVQDSILNGSIVIPRIEGVPVQRIKPNGFLVNGIVKYQKTFMRVLRMALDDKLDININILDKNLVLEETANSKDIYIDEDELQKIVDYAATSAEMQMAKDYVILASLTGMRYESMVDAFKSKIEVFKSKKHNFSHIHSKQIKTGTECIIPLFKPVLNVLDNYDNKFPKFIDNSRINGLIKILFSDVGVIFETVVKNYYYKKGLIEETKKVSDIVTTHDFRKSFSTNLYLKQVAQTQIDNVTHPDKKPDNKMAAVYNKASMLDNAKLFVDEVVKANKLNQSSLYTF